MLFESQSRQISASCMQQITPCNNRIATLAPSSWWPTRRLAIRSEMNILNTQYHLSYLHVFLVSVLNFKPHQIPRKFTYHFRGLHGVYLKLMKETWKITTCGQPIIHVQNALWTRHVDNLNEGKPLYWLRLDKIAKTWLELHPEAVMFWNLVLSYTQNLPLHCLCYLVSLCIWIYATWSLLIIGSIVYYKDWIGCMDII